MRFIYSRFHVRKNCLYSNPIKGLQGRKERYRFAFNGKENDNEVKGNGNQQDYGMRIYDNRLGRFLSADPLIISMQKYPELSPYQFASNRPIDGIDQDGLEYATFTILIKNGKVLAITVKTDYELKDKNSLGPGILYNYAYYNKNSKLERFVQGPLVKNMYGIYQGADNPRLPKIGGDPTVTDWDYRLPPIDNQDALAFKHDLAYDKLKPKQAGFSGVMHPSTTSANLDAAKGALKTLESYAVGNFIPGNQTPSNGAAGAAVMMSGGFTLAEGTKLMEQSNFFGSAVKAAPSPTGMLESTGNLINEIKNKAIEGINSLSTPKSLY